MGKRKRTWPYIKAFNAHVRGTKPRSHIRLVEAEIRTLSRPLHTQLSLLHPGLSRTASITTRVLKHIYDDHGAHAPEIIKHLAAMVGSPSIVYENKPGRAGMYIFAIRVDTRTYCGVMDIERTRHGRCVLHVRTAFYASNPTAYLSGLNCVWLNVSRFVEPGGQRIPPS